MTAEPEIETEEPGKPEKAAPDPFMRTLESEVKAAGKSMPWFKKELGLSSQRYNNWRKRGIPPSNVYEVARLMGWDAGALAEERIELSDLPQDLIEIPRYDASGSMGPGVSVPEFNSVIERITLSSAWARANLDMTSPANLAVITGMGDSMTPTFQDGDLLLVDRGVTEVKVDGVYVLCRGDELFIKRVLRRYMSGTLEIISDKIPEKSEVIAGEDIDRVTVLARVLIALNMRRL